MAMGGGCEPGCGWLLAHPAGLGAASIGAPRASGGSARCSHDALAASSSTTSGVRGTVKPLSELHSHGGAAAGAAAARAAATAELDDEKGGSAPRVRASAISPSRVTAESEPT